MLAPTSERTNPVDNWHVLLAQPRQERRAAARLRAERIEVYLPETAERRLRGRKMQDHLEPMLPGYLFIPAGHGVPWYRIGSTPGIRLDGDGSPALMRNGAYATVPNWAIEIVRAKEGKLRGGFERRPGALWLGQQIEAVAGPFRWFQGKIDNLGRLDTHGRVSAAMDIFGRLTSVEFEVSQVRAV